jgi:hypothetical protein
MYPVFGVCRYFFCEHAKALRVIALEEKEADYSGSGI